MENQSEEQKKEEVKEEEVKDEVNTDQEVKEEVKEDRPEANYKAELERKNREIERMRQELSMRQDQPRQRDPNDISTWNDQELKAIVASNDPSTLPYKDKANDLLLDRKVDARLAQKAETNKRVTAEMQLREQFPDALDPASELALRMDKIIQENDLSRTPAGRLVAAKLAASELGQGKKSSDARGRKIENDRVARVKGQMVDGDRPEPTQSKDSKNLGEKRQKLAESLMKSNQPGKQNEADSNAAMSEIIKDRFGGRKGFFGDK